MRGATLIKIAGYVAAIAAPLGAVATETITYTYDAQGRLVAVVSTGTVNNNVQTTYTHDAADNRQRVVVTGSPNSP